MITIDDWCLLLNIQHQVWIMLHFQVQEKLALLHHQPHSKKIMAKDKILP